MDRIAVQTYSFGFDKPVVLTEQFRQAAQLGYTGVELIRNYPEIPVETLKAAAKEAGIEIVSAHVTMQYIQNDLPYLAELGMKLVVCPVHPFGTRDEALICAAELNCMGHVAARYGIRVGYHNHTNEFYAPDGTPLLDVVMENTDPSCVVMELDCGWASAAGVDPAAYIRRHAGRVAAIHVKENADVVGTETPRSRYDLTPWPVYPKDEHGKEILPPQEAARRARYRALNCPTGQGIVDWRAVKAAADAQDPQVLYIVEREADYGGKDRLTCLGEDCRWIRENL